MCQMTKNLLTMSSHTCSLTLVTDWTILTKTKAKTQTQKQKQKHKKAKTKTKAETKSDKQKHMQFNIIYTGWK